MAAGGGLKAATSLLQGLGGGGGSSSSGGGPSQQDFQALAFQNQQGKLAANQFGAQTGTGNYTGTVMAQNANDIQTMTGLGALQQQQEIQALNAGANANQANGLLSGLFGSNTGSFAGGGGSAGGGGASGGF